MANNTSTFVLRLTTQGLQQAQQQTQAIRDNLEAAAAAARQIPGGTAGSRRVAQSAAQPASGAMASGTGSAQQSYSNTRGVIGTGASARDFARQAEGLSGLVRIYATLAANIYAATAAFNALSEAANISNLIKGLDQLSASSGKNLTKVAKDLVTITDGSISLQEAIKVVAKASTAEISTDNIRKLGEIAQKASQTLGIDVSTALDRLTRGVTKLEPELLDELGLFTKIGPATEAYARQIGKSSAALTDLERRQAFANAVIKEGFDKYNDIATDANPFSRLAAKLKELSLVATTFINKGIIPIVELLSSSPVALAGVLALIGKSLLGFTIPAVATWRNGMKAAADQANELAQQAVENRRQNRAWRDSIVGLQVAEDSARAKQEARLKITELQTKAADQANRVSAETRRLAATLTPDAAISSDTGRQAYQKQIDDLEKRKQKLETELSTMQRQTGVQAAAKRAEVQDINATTAAMRERLRTEVEFNRIINEPRPSRWSREAEDETRARQRILDAQKKNIVSNALERQSIDGTIAGFRALREGIRNAQQGLDTAGQAYTDGTQKLGAFRGALLTVSGAAQLAGEAISRLANFINKALIYIAIFTAVFQGLDMWLSKSKKQEEAFKDSTDKLTGSIKVAGDALDEIAKKKFLDSKGIQATANALNELTDGLRKQIKTFVDLRTAQSGWDRWWDDRWASIGRGSEDKLAANITDTILASLSLVEAENRDKVQKQYENILGFKFIDRATLLSGVKNLTKDGVAEVLQLVPAFEAVGKQAAASASNITLLDNGLGEISKQINDLNNSLKLTDIQGKLGTALLAESERMAKAFESPKTAILALQKVVNDFNLLSLFPQQQEKNLENQEKDLIKNRTEVERLSKAYQEAESKVKQLQTRFETAGEADKGVVAQQLKIAQENFKAIRAETDTFVKKFESTIKSGIIEQAFKRVEVSLKSAIQEAGIILKKSQISAMQSIGAATAAEETRLKVQELEIQKTLIQANYENANQIMQLRLIAEQQLQIDRIKLAEDIKENAASQQKSQETAKTQAQEFLKLVKEAPAAAKKSAAGVPGIVDSGMSAPRAPKGAIPIEGAQGLFYDKAKFDRLVAEAQQTVERSVQTTEQIIEEQNGIIRDSYKALFDSTKASKDFFIKGKLNFNAVGEAAKQTGTFSSQVAKELLIQSKGLQAALVKLDAQIAGTKLEGGVKEITEKAAKKSEGEQRKAAGIEVSIAEVSAQESLIGIYSEQLSLSKQKLEQDLLSAQAKQDDLKLAGAVEAAQYVINKLTETEGKNSEKVKESQKALKALEEERANNQASWAQKRTALDAKYYKDRFMEADRLSQLEKDYQDTLIKNSEELSKTAVDNKKQELDALVATGKVSAEYAANRIADIAKENQALTYQSQLREALNQRDAAMKAALNKAVLREIAGEDPETVTAQRNAEENKALAIYDAKVVSINAANAGTLRGIELTKQQSLETAAANALLEKQKTQMDSMKSITESLAVLFGNLGSGVAVFAANMGKAGEALLENSQRQETFNAKYKELTDTIQRIESIDDPLNLSPETQEVYNKAIQDRSKLVKKNTADEIAGNIKVVSSAKSMFKEKTVAYKAIGTIEKGLHAMKLANDAKELASTLGLISKETAATIGGVIKEIPAYAAKIYGKTIGQLGPIAGPVVATALLAALYSFIGGGGGAPQPAGVTAKEQQEVQGTGQIYRDGKLVSTGAGVLGDDKAKSESIAKGIQAIEKYNFKNLEYGSEMLDALKAIERNTKSFTSSLLKAVPNLNITPETIKSGNWLFGKETTETLDRGIKIIGNVGQIIDKAAKILEYTTTKTTEGSGLFNLFGLFASDPTIGGSQREIEDSQRLQEDLSKIFSEMGKALTKAGSDLGLTTGTAVMDAFRSIDLSEQLKTSLMGLTGKDAAEAMLNVISSGLDTAAATIFPSLTKFREVGESFGDTVIRLANDMRVVNLSFEELGFTLPKLAETGARATTEQLNRLTRAQTAYTAALAANNVETQVWVEENAYNGTGSMQTMKGTTESAAALAAAQRELTAATNEVNLANSSLTTKNIELVQALIEAAGGLDEFVERNRFFAENFLTEAERLVPVQEAVTKELGRLDARMSELGFDNLNIDAINTREGFKNLVMSLENTNNALNITTPAGLELYTALMKVQYGFAEVYKAAELASMSAEEFSKKVFSNEVDILKAQAGILENNKDFVGAYNKTQEAVALTRKAELAELEKLPEAQRTVLIYQAKYKHSLEDIASKAKLTEQQNRALIDSYNEQIKVQQEFVAYLDEALGMVLQAFRLRGSGQDLAALKFVERSIKLQDIAAKYAGAENEIRRNNIIGLQKYIWALEDEQEARNNYLQAISNFSQAIEQEVAKLQANVQYFDTYLGMIVEASNLRGAAGDAEAVKYIERSIKLQDLGLQYAGAENEQRLRNLTLIQQYIWAAQDEEKARNDYLDAISDFSNAIDREVAKLQTNVQYFDTYLGMIVEASNLRGSAGDLEAVKYIERSIKLQDLGLQYAGRENEQRLRNLTLIQQYIWALQDEEEARNNYLEAISNYSDAIEREISKLETQVQYFDNYLGLVSEAISLGGTAFSSVDVKTIERTIKLQDLSREYAGKENEQKLANITATQKYIWALQDEQEAKDKYLDALSKFSDAIGREVTKLESNVQYLDKVLNMLVEVSNLGGISSGFAKDIQRTITLQDLSREYSGKENEQKLKTVTGLQKYIWALQDEQEAKDKYVSALQAQVAAAEKEISKLEENIQAYDSLLDQKARIAELKSGSEAVAKVLSRERELTNLRKNQTAEIADALVANQEYIWALEDEQDLKAKLIEQRDKEKQAIEDTISSLEGAVKSLKEYSDSLNLSENLTILTPEQQYQEARKTFENVLATARTPGSTEKERQAQLEAVAKLPEVSNKFLELSRTMFASSDSYMDDFKLVRDSISQTAGQLDVQLTDAQLQLKQLEESTAFLESIEQSSKTTAELLIEYGAAQTRTAEAATKANTMSVEQITALKETAESRIGFLNTQIEDTNLLIESLTEKSLSYQEAQAASMSAQEEYSAASSNTLSALADIQGDISDAAIMGMLSDRNEAVTQIGLLQNQLTALQDIETAINGLLTLEDAKIAYRTAAENYGAAKDSTIAAGLGVTDSTDLTLANRNAAVIDIISYQAQTDALQDLADAINRIPTKEEAETAYKNAITAYATATGAANTAATNLLNRITGTDVNNTVLARSSTLVTVADYQAQTTALQNLANAINRIPTKEEAETAYKNAITAYATATSGANTAITNLLNQLTGTDVNNTVLARSSTLVTVADYQAQTTALTNLTNAINRVPNKEEAETAYENAARDYGSAKDSTISSYIGIQNDINGATISAGIAARADTLRSITTNTALIAGLQRVETNMYAMYETQRTHFNNLLQTPQQVNVGTGVATTLANVANNTAKVADALQDVKTAIVEGTIVTTTTNTEAVQAQTEEFVAVVETLSSDWQKRTIPPILQESGILKER